MTKKPPSRIETWRLDDGTIEERVYVNNKMIDKRHTPPPEATPYRQNVNGNTRKHFPVTGKAQ